MSRYERIKKFFRENFFSGLLVVVPVVVSIYVFYQVLGWLYHKLVFLPIDNERIAQWLAPIIPRWGVISAVKLVHVAEFVIVLFLVILATALVGMFTKIRFTNWLFGMGERTLEKIPLLGVIYSALKQLIRSIFSGKGAFSKVVMVQFPQEGVWSVGFVSRQMEAALMKIPGNKKMYNVFIPTTPNVTTGFLVVVPAQRIIELDISIDQAFKFILSGGMVLPHEDVQETPEAGESIIDKIKNAARKNKPGAAAAKPRATDPGISGDDLETREEQ